MAKGWSELRSGAGTVARRIIGASAFAAAALVQTSGLAADAMLRIEVDEAEVFPLTEIPSTVIVGNPLVADVTVHHGNLLVILGKNYGTTNVIVLDHDSREIANVALNVVTSGINEVSLFRGSGRITLNCSPICERELNVGDAPTMFDTLQDQIGKKTGHSGNAVSSGGADGE